MNIKSKKGLGPFKKLFDPKLNKLSIFTSSRQNRDFSRT